MGLKSRLFGSPPDRFEQRVLAGIRSTPGPGGIFHVPWDVVADVTAPLLPVEGLRPERYRVPNWPSPATVDVLRERATTP